MKKMNLYIDHYTKVYLLYKCTQYIIKHIKCILKLILLIKFVIRNMFVSSTMNINARGVLRISQAVVKNMISAEISGSIVNISSTISQVIIYAR